MQERQIVAASENLSGLKRWPHEEKAVMTGYIFECRQCLLWVNNGIVSERGFMFMLKLNCATWD